MTLLPLHILGGLTAIVAGFVAVSAHKGATPHRTSGIIFVYAMMVMSASGALMAMIRLNRGNIMGGGLTFYMVTTALLTTRPRVARVDRGVALLGLAVGVAGCAFGFSALHSATGRLDRYPSPLYFVFGSIALLSVAGDVRMLLSHGLQGRARLVRHLWRMCSAMFMATASFFLGQAKLFPKPVRIFPLLAIPALLPLVLLLYWLVRVSWTHRRARASRTISLKTVPAV
jgi:uncharacterized membrane protein